MICSSCNNYIPDNAKYCTVCGMLIVDKPDQSPDTHDVSEERQGAVTPEKREDAVREDTYRNSVLNGQDAHEPDAAAVEPASYKPPAGNYDYTPLYLRKPEYKTPSGQEGNNAADRASAESRQETQVGTDEQRVPPYRPGSITVKSSGMEQKLSAGQFFVMELLCLIPVIGFIAMCVWAFSKNTNANRAAYAQAKLIIMLMATVVLLIAFIVFLILAANGVITLRWLTIY